MILHAELAASHLWQPLSSLVIELTSFSPGTADAQDVSVKIRTVIGENPRGYFESEFSLLDLEVTSALHHDKEKPGLNWQNWASWPWSKTKISCSFNDTCIFFVWKNRWLHMQRKRSCNVIRTWRAAKCPFSKLLFPRFRKKTQNICLKISASGQ